MRIVVIYSLDILLFILFVVHICCYLVSSNQVTEKFLGSYIMSILIEASDIDSVPASRQWVLLHIEMCFQS